MVATPFSVRLLVGAARRFRPSAGRVRRRSLSLLSREDARSLLTTSEISRRVVGKARPHGSDIFPARPTVSVATDSKPYTHPSRALKTRVFKVLMISVKGWPRCAIHSSTTWPGGVRPYAPPPPRSLHRNGSPVAHKSARETRTPRVGLFPRVHSARADGLLYARRAARVSQSVATTTPPGWSPKVKKYSFDFVVAMPEGRQTPSLPRHSYST